MLCAIFSSKVDQGCLVFKPARKRKSFETDIPGKDSMPACPMTLLEISADCPDDIRAIIIEFSKTWASTIRRLPPINGELFPKWAKVLLKAPEKKLSGCKMLWSTTGDTRATQVSFVPDFTGSNPQGETKWWEVMQPIYKEGLPHRGSFRFRLRLSIILLCSGLRRRTLVFLVQNVRCSHPAMLASSTTCFDVAIQHPGLILSKDETSSPFVLGAYS